MSQRADDLPVVRHADALEAPGDSYTVERHPYGIVVRGAVPLGELRDLCRMWKRRGYKIWDIALAAHFKAPLVLVRDYETSRKWRSELGVVVGDPQ